jgi:DNA-binding XRE family transcriptional regulator
MILCAAALSPGLAYAAPSTPLSVGAQVVRFGGQYFQFDLQKSSSPASDEGFSIDEVIAEFESKHGTAPLSEGDRWVANVLYPEHTDEPTLAVLRLKAGLSQRALADLMAVKQPYIARLERGNVNVTFDTMRKLANALNTDIKSIAGAIEKTIRLSAENA